MIKRISITALFALIPSLALAQLPPNSYPGSGPLTGDSTVAIAPAGSGWTIKTTGTLSSLTIKGATSGQATLTVPAAAGTPTITLPTVNTTGPTAQPGTSGMVLKSTTAGVQSYAAIPWPIDAGTNTFGLSTAFPSTTVISSHVAPFAGHFVTLTCSSVQFGVCTTAPIVAVFDNTTGATAAELQCPNTASETIGTGTSSAQTQTFAAGDTVGIYVVTQGGTCLADEFNVSADATVP